MKNELVSVVVAVYNTSFFLHRCLDSIINQTYNNIEIIIVNDGSTDNSQEIINDYKIKDKRIVSLKKRNGGLASARNAGIKIARGDYIYFVDSDDYLRIRAIEIMMDAIEKTNSDMAICSYDTKEIDGYDNNIKLTTFDNHELEKQLFLDKTITSHSWRKIYPKKSFNNHKFPEEKKVVQDMGADHYFLSVINKAVLVDAPLYVYTIDNPSNLTNSNSKSILSSLNRAKVLIDRLEFADSYYPDISYILLPQITMFLLSSYVKLKKYSPDNKEELSFVFDSISKYKKRILKSDDVNFTNKVVIYSIIKDIKPLIWLSSKYYFCIFSK